MRCTILVTGVVLCLACGNSDARAAKTITATSFGAAAGDNKDDSAAINSAIQSAEPGDTVTLPAGTMVLHNSIVLKTGVKLIGAGRDKTVLRFAGTRLTSLINLGSSSTVELTGFTLDGNRSAKAGQGIAAGKGSGHRLHGLRIRNLAGENVFGPHGIYFSADVTDSRISDNEFIDIGPQSKTAAAIRIDWRSNRNQVLRNTIRNTGRGAILAKASTNLVIRENVVSGSGKATEGVGIELAAGCDRSLVEDNQLDHWLSMAGVSFSAVRRNTVGVRAGSLKYCGIHLGPGSDVVLTDNVADGGAQIGLSISGKTAKQRAFWARNRVRNAETWGMQIQGEEGGAHMMYFFDNTVEQTRRGGSSLFPNYPDGHGVRLNGNCLNIVLDRNRIVNNGGTGIQINGPNVDQIIIVGNTITGNGGRSVTVDYGSSEEYHGRDLLWEENLVSGNAGGDLALESVGFDRPRAEVRIDAPQRVEAGRPVSFRFQFVDPLRRVANVLWDLGESLPSTDLAPTRTFRKPGTYRVCLIVWNYGGRAVLAQHVLTVVAPPKPAAKP